MPMLSVQQKATRRMTISRDMRRSRVVVAPGMRRRLLPGNRDISGSSLQTPAGTASGRPEAEADDERSREVGFAHSSGEASERSGASRRGGGGAKGWNQGECGPANHGPDTEPESRVTCAGPHTGRRKQEPHRATDRALASRDHRCLASGFLQSEEGRCPRHRWGIVGRLRGRPRDEPRESLRTRPYGRVSGYGLSSSVHTEGGWSSQQGDLLNREIRELVFELSGVNAHAMLPPKKARSTK